MSDALDGTEAAETPDPGERSLWWVAVYLTDRIYGGPEEGGWYFDRGTLVTDPGIYPSFDAAAFGNKLQRTADLEWLRDGMCRAGL